VADVPPGLVGVNAIAAGYGHSLALKDDGTVVAWGYNRSGQIDVPGGLTDVVAIAAGGEHNLALEADGTLVTWGSDAHGQDDIPIGLTDVGAIAAGSWHNLVTAVYDPSAGGFVTGGGWIYSEVGNYLPDTNSEGKATFAFVAKYKKGATVPTGNTTVHFRPADLNFHSTSYDSLVVTVNDTAILKGAGTINGEGAYKFQIWAEADDPDAIRIKIWTEIDVETVIYDNGDEQAIGGGNIAIHTKK
jgi:hypothetical protein